MSSRKYFAAPVAVFALGSSLALGFVTSPAVPAHADSCFTENWAPMECPGGEVLLSDIDVDSFPMCVQEDCSDQPEQTGMWLDSDTGNWYLELGESVTFLVVDDTVQSTGREIKDVQP